MNDLDSISHSTSILDASILRESNRRFVRIKLGLHQGCKYEKWTGVIVDFKLWYSSFHLRLSPILTVTLKISDC